MVYAGMDDSIPSGPPDRFRPLTRLSGFFKTLTRSCPNLRLPSTDQRERFMDFAYTILYVHDVPRSLAFYQAAFGFQLRFQHDSGTYGELDTGPTRLAFSSRALMAQLGKHPAPANAAAPVFEIAFSTADVAGAVARAVAAGATLHQAPQPMPWGQTVAYVVDLDGFLVELCTPVN